ncbi:MAG TPA: pitrilysin family protein [Pyrinomonadaceae bacterium]|nr:pitrilysin family protein [Pyrinomonadaceae bacterium]
MKNYTKLVFGFWFLAFGSLCIFAQQPKPGAAKPIKVPAVSEKKLSNGLKVATVERKNVPLVTIQLLIGTGADGERESLAGLADMTATLLTKGTKTRSAKQIAEQIEFLGGSINSGAGWNNSEVSITVSSDKLEQAMTILADVVMNPTFKDEEIDLLKGQMLDELAYNLQQPGFLAGFVSSKYSFDEHPIGGTIESINKITREDILNYKKYHYLPDESFLIFTGDVNSIRANTLAQKFFGRWMKFKFEVKELVSFNKEEQNVNSIVKRLLVVDLPDSGQAAVYFNKTIEKIGRKDSKFYSASVLNSVLGGGYSSRLNQEIRIKRGLSYGAGSSFAWRGWNTNFGARTQTKNESAAEVAELIVGEIKRLTETNVSPTEMMPRKLVLIGDFGRDLETTQGLADSLGELYTFGLPTTELNSFMKNVQSVTDSQVRDFAKNYLLGGDLVIVGDYAKFKDDLAKRFPNMKIDVIKADELDLSKENLRK